MSVYVFTGPTLPPAEARQVLDAVYLPPAAHGDIYRVARTHPQAIGLIDGVFDTAPAVWHKEILWAMREGVHVFGSAGMGALRAAELAAFGMEGVGEVFAALQRGELEDDDEVAVDYRAVEGDYHTLSVALVDMRATLAQAAAQGIISARRHAALVELAKSLYYPDRTYQQILALAGDEDRSELAALRSWLPAHQVNLMRQDALTVLRVMQQRCAGELGPKQVRYHFEHTVYWDRAIQRLADDDDRSTSEPAQPPPLSYWHAIDLAFFQRGYSIDKEAEPSSALGPPPGRTPRPPGPFIQLADQPLDTSVSLRQVLAQRRSRRAYGPHGLTLDQLGQFLYASARAQGVFEHPTLGMTSHRPSPSAGGRHPLEIYAVCNAVDGLPQGVYYYDPFEHGLALVKAADAQQERLNNAVAYAMSRGVNPQPPALICLITACFARTLWAYQHIGLRLILNDVGALYQTMYLVGTAMGLAPCAVGTALPDEYTRWLGLEPLVEAPVGCFALGTRLPDVPKSRISISQEGL